ncbi:hypothetical protein DPMN_165198 [Dreissena polymorpha]|uniref:Uncharacterized protein n=1 Tax=Dreissena polymorpha TaxID=45954 RepID=A0A9D4EWN9_DREPO|nr:hypothetical protein DPMN_165198 [Dreissena polymorpha]
MARQRPTQVMLKQNFGWAWSMWAVRPMIDRIVIRVVQYQLEVNRCRNEEVIVKGNFGWVWPIWAGPWGMEYRVVIRDVQINEKVVLKHTFGWAWSMWAGRPRDGNRAMHNVQYQFEFLGSSANSVGGDSGQDERTDVQTAEITT